MSLEEAVEGSDCIVVLTDHSSFKEIDLNELSGKMRNLSVIDSRNIISDTERIGLKFVINTLGEAHNAK